MLRFNFYHTGIGGLSESGCAVEADEWWWMILMMGRF